MAFRLANGWVPTGGLVVMHSCDNPPCCNPKHLESGTLRQNAQDCVARGRHHRTSVRGEASGMAILTESSVCALRALHAEGIGYRKLAREFGVSRACVRSAALGKTWRHV